VSQKSKPTSIYMCVVLASDRTILHRNVRKIAQLGKVKLLTLYFRSLDTIVDTEQVSRIVTSMIGAVTKLIDVLSSAIVTYLAPDGSFTLPSVLILPTPK
jgi:hypothetical protein